MPTKNTTHIVVSDVPAVKSETIDDATKIVEQFRSAVTSWDCYKILQEIFLHFIQTGGLEEVSEETRNHYCSCMQTIGDAICSLERYAQDWDAGILIMKYMETLQGADKPQMDAVVGSLKQLENKYGSIRKGLDSLLEHKDSLDRAEAVRRRNE